MKPFNYRNASFLNYLVQKQLKPGEKLPKLRDISNELGISVGKLREQLEMARHLGLVSARPRVGIQREHFDFSAVIRDAVLFSMATGEGTFAQFSQLRRGMEVSLWADAVERLTEQDKDELKQLIEQAWQKLGGKPIHIPNREHKQLHLKIFSRLENPYALGILETYWEAYEASELTRFSSLAYWVEVWKYHENIVKAICAGEVEQGRQLLIEHFSLLQTEPEVDVLQDRYLAQNRHLDPNQHSVNGREA